MFANRCLASCLLWFCIALVYGFIVFYIYIYICIYTFAVVLITFCFVLYTFFFVCFIVYVLWFMFVLIDFIGFSQKHCCTCHHRRPGKLNRIWTADDHHLGGPKCRVAHLTRRFPYVAHRELKWNCLWHFQHETLQHDPRGNQPRWTDTSARPDDLKCEARPFSQYLSQWRWTYCV